MAVLANTLMQQGVRALRALLPPGWSASAPTRRAAMPSTDAMVRIRAPDLRTGAILVETRARLAPNQVQAMIDARRPVDKPTARMVIAPYLSERAQLRLRDAQISYLDLAGNARVVMALPGLYIETHGASVDPAPDPHQVRSLRGPKAGRIARALIDHKVPPGVREIAGLTKVRPGYVSKVLALLDAEALITRSAGKPRTVDWPALLRRWARDAPLESRGDVGTYLDPRGISALLSRLGKSDERYVVTGGLAAAAFAPIAPARLAMIWMHDAVAAAARLGCRPAESGANVLLIEPRDEAVFDGAAQRNGVWNATLAQTALDLLVSPGRGPGEGEELISWMQANEDRWRR